MRPREKRSARGGGGNVQCKWDAKNGIARLEIPTDRHTLRAIQAACYTFIGKCYIFLAGESKGNMRIWLRPKGKWGRESTTLFVRELEGELRAQALRLTIDRRTRKEREALFNDALAGSARPPAGGGADPELDKILKEAEKADYTADPLGIAIPWEEKYGKGKEPVDRAPSAEGNPGTSVAPPGGDDPARR